MFGIRCDELQRILIFLPKVLVDIILKYYLEVIIVKIIFKRNIVRIYSRKVRLFNEKFQFSFNLCNKDDIYYLFPNNMNNNKNIFNNITCQLLSSFTNTHSSKKLVISSSKIIQNVNDYLTFFEYYSNKKLFNCKTDLNIMCTKINEDMFLLTNNITNERMKINILHHSIVCDMIILFKHIVNRIIDGQFKPQEHTF